MKGVEGMVGVKEAEWNRLVETGQATSRSLTPIPEFFKAFSY